MTARPTAPCCGPLVLKTKILTSPRSALLPPGAWSPPAICILINLAVKAAEGTDAAGGKAIIFNTITVSDGISMGSEGMKYSLVSREVIADSIETVIGCQGFDGLVAIGGCDKNMPGCIMAMARLNRPSVFVYGGTILPGCFNGQESGYCFSV